MLEIVHALPEHAEPIGLYLRQGDLGEANAWGFDGVAGVKSSFEWADQSYVCLEDGRPIAGWGYKAMARPQDTLIGGIEMAHLWCLTTHRVEAHKKSILRFSREFVTAMQARFPRLESTVDPRYEAAVRWDKWLGFKICATIKVGGLDYHVVCRERGYTDWA